MTSFIWLFVRQNRHSMRKEAYESIGCLSRSALIDSAELVEVSSLSVEYIMWLHQTSVLITSEIGAQP